MVDGMTGTLYIAICHDVRKRMEHKPMHKELIPNKLILNTPLKMVVLEFPNPLLYLFRT